jgi:TP901 family phage tail tape measure protein
MATGLIGALRITLGIDASEFEAGTSKAKAEMRGFQRDFERMGKKWQNMGRDFSTYVTVPVLAAGAGVLKMAGDFEAAMIRVGISTEASSAQMAEMREMAKQLGADTIFSASEAASGMDMLAKAGVKTTDIINGAAKAVVDLAAAAGSELDPAAAAISDAMTQFGLKTSQLPGIVNTITGAVNESKLSFEDYTLAAGQAGGVAGSAGIDFKEFATSIAATSGMFNSGSDAGTSFKTFLQRLVPDTKKAANAMKDVGFNAFDANGKMKSLRDIAEMLQQKFGNMSEQDRAGYFKTMFGQDAIRTAIGLMKLGGEGFDEMMAKINATDASEQAAKRMEGFNAQMEQFKGALENLAIAIGESGFLEAMTRFVEKITELINGLSKSNPEMLKWGTIIAGVAAAFGPFMLVFGTFIRAVGVVLPLLVKLGPAFRVIGSAIGFLIPLVANIARVLLVGLLGNPILLGAVALLGGIYLAWKNWDKIGPIVQNLYNQVKQWLGDKLGQALDYVKGKVDAVTGWFRDMYVAVVGNSYVPDMVDEIGQHMARLKENMVDPAQKATTTAADAFRAMQQEVGAILDRLFPEEARYQQFLAEMMLLEAQMQKMGFSADQTAEAIRRLRDEYRDDRFGPDADGPPKWLEDYQAPEKLDIDWDPIIRSSDRAADEILKTTQDKTLQMAEAWAGMARDAVSSLKSMVESFKSGDILGGIMQVLDVITQVIGMINGTGKAATPVYVRGGGGGSSGAPGFAGGGAFKVGGSGGVDSKLVRFRATPGEMVNITKGERDTRQSNVLRFDLRGAVMTQDLLRQMEGMANHASVSGALGGATLAATTMKKRNRGGLQG